MISKKNYAVVRAESEALDAFHGEKCTFLG